MKKEVTRTWIVEKTTRLSELMIQEGGSIAAPEGKFVYMTVDGVGRDILPGRYRGEIVLSVAETYHMTPHSLLRMTNRSKEFRNALVVDTSEGKVVDEKSVPAAIQGGTISGKEVDGAYIASSAESFNGILAIGSGSYTVKNTRIEMEGFGENDFVGMGSGIEAIDKVDLTIEDCDIQVNGVTRTSVHVGGDSHVLVKNTRIQNTSPDSDWLGDFSWACGFTGTNRLCQLTDNGSVRYENCHLKTNGWGILSIDGTLKHNDMVIKDSRLELSGPRAHGYGAFCIGGNHVRMEGCDVRVNGYPLLLRGMEDQGRAEIIDTRISGRRFGVMAMGDTHSVLTIEGSSFRTDKSTLVFKGSATEINVKNTEMVPGNGVIMQLMDNDEGGMNAQDFHVPLGETDVPDSSHDLTAVGNDDIRLNLTDCTLTGDFYNSTSNIRANKRSTMGGMGKFHDAVIGVMAPPTMAALPEGEEIPAEFTMEKVDLDVAKNLAVTLRSTSITGVISSAAQKYRDGLTLIDESNRLEMSNITQTAAPTVNNGVIVCLDAKSKWTVTGTSYITKLVLASGAAVTGPEGQRVWMSVDGVETNIAPGTYTGRIILRVS
ncbi:MAG: right-handed parallel beta-helix repeat-containing protein [Oscillospiraceae bacterium]|nr:right-handed parallel beta-helix repeat-containing protein [Oscillospiraceae bacterium]